MSFAGPALLFAPADRPDRVVKAAERADLVIIDLEDGVAPPDRQRAREALAALTIPAERVIVRVNPIGTPDHAADMEVVARTSYRRLMLAKAEDAAGLDTFAPHVEIVALCETARGVANAREIAEHPRVIALMWGAEDLIASLGGSASRTTSGTYRDVARQARSLVLLAAGAAGKTAIDAVHLDIPDVDGLRAECEDAVASGFSATACIHPSQVAVVREAYAPRAEEIAYAEAVLAAAVGEAGVFAFNGRMVDEPVLRHARAVLARADAMR